MSISRRPLLQGGDCQVYISHPRTLGQRRESGELLPMCRSCLGNGSTCSNDYYRFVKDHAKKSLLPKLPRKNIVNYYSLIIRLSISLMYAASRIKASSLRTSWSVMYSEKSASGSPVKKARRVFVPFNRTYAYTSGAPANKGQAKNSKKGKVPCLVWSVCMQSRNRNTDR